MLTLARLRVSANARLDRTLAQRALTAMGEETKLREKHRNDAVRVAAAYRLRKTPNLQDEDGNRVDILAVEPKSSTSDNFEMCFHIRHKGKKVDYSDLIAHLKVLENGDTSLSWPDFNNHNPKPWGQAIEKVYLSDRMNLVELGQQFLFDKDIRRQVENGPFSKLTKIFPGTWLTTHSDEVETLKKWNETFLSGEALVEGDASITILELNDNEVNRAAIAQEIADNFAAEFNTIAAKCAEVGPLLSRLMKDYEDVLKRMQIASAALKVPLEVSDEMESCELALMLLEAEEEAKKNG